MSHSFTHDSDSIPSRKDPALRAVLTVYFDITATAEDDAYAENVLIWDTERDCEVFPAQLSTEESAAIEERCQDTANENAHKVWYEAQIMRAEALRDAQEDR